MPAEENATERQEVTLEGEYFSDSSYGTGEENIDYRTPGELSESDPNDKQHGAEDQIDDQTGEEFRDSRGLQGNHIQSFIDLDGHRYAIYGPGDNTANILMGSEVHGESIQWAYIDEGGSGNGGDPNEEGSSDGWGDGTSESTTNLGENVTETHSDRNNIQACVNGTKITNPNNEGKGDAGPVDNEEGFQGRGDVSPETEHVTCLEKKRNDGLDSNGNTKVSYLFNYPKDVLPVCV